MENSIDAVASRDLAIEFVFVLSLSLIDVSRLCEEITLWASQQFGWVRLSDEFSTGSSIMPQKKNPDAAELTRGRSGRVLGDLMGLMAAVKALPLAYNRDLSEDKNAVFDAVDTMEITLPALAGLIRTMDVNVDELRSQAGRGGTLATEIADWLACQGVPFSEAHHVAGAAVQYSESRGVDIADFDADDLAAIDARLTPDALDALSVDAALASRSGANGTAPRQVRRQLDRLRDEIAEVRRWVDLTTSDASLTALLGLPDPLTLSPTR